MTVFKHHDCQCDSIAANQALLSVRRATEIAVGLVSPLDGSELVTLNQALGRIVLKDLRAPAAMPFFDNSAMDGYAVSTRSFQQDDPWKLRVAGTIAAGDQLPQTRPGLLPAHALRIFTGAPVPEGYDAVIAQENVQLENGCIIVERKPETGTNIRRAGSDVGRGAMLIEAGSRIAAHHIGLLAANGYNAINVARLPRVALFSTGDELAKPGEKVKPGQVYDCNKPMLMALFAETGIAIDDLGALPDDLPTTQQLLGSCRDKYDLVISTGSVSVGEKDFLKTAFMAAGGFVKNWKVAVKPGKPVMFGKLGTTAVTGLPGNPFAAFVGFHLFVKPQVMRLCGEKQNIKKPMWAIADFSWSRKPGRTEIFPVRIQGVSGEGLTRISRLGNSVSATLYPLSKADGLAEVPANCAEIRPGDIIHWQPFCN